MRNLLALRLREVTEGYSACCMLSVLNILLKIYLASCLRICAYKTEDG